MSELHHLLFAIDPADYGLIAGSNSKLIYGYYGAYRFTLITPLPLEQLVDRVAACKLETSYGRRGLVLPGEEERKQIIVRVDHLLPEGTNGQPLCEVIQQRAPRRNMVGRRRIHAGAPTQIVRASVPVDAVETFRTLGNGNISEGIRIAASLADEMIT